jgi:hypothetical protein
MTAHHWDALSATDAVEAPGAEPQARLSHEAAARTASPNNCRGETKGAFSTDNLRDVWLPGSLVLANVLQSPVV